jgi:hypothetical protein
VLIEARKTRSATPTRINTAAANASLQVTRDSSHSTTTRPTGAAGGNVDLRVTRADTMKENVHDLQRKPSSREKTSPFPVSKSESNAPLIDVDDDATLKLQEFMRKMQEKGVQARPKPTPAKMAARKTQSDLLS